MNKLPVVMLVSGVLAGGGAVFLSVAPAWTPMAAAAETSAAPQSAVQPVSHAERKILYYRNPMGQPDTSPVPKKDSMGMDYIPVYADADSSAPAGLVKIDPVRRQNLGVTSTAVVAAVLQRHLRATGVFAVDERRQYTLTTKLDGWVDKLYVNATGEQVRAGQPLFELYSPDLVVAQQEYLIARKTQLNPDKPQTNGFSDAALSRLKYWDIPQAAIRRLASEGEVKRTLPIDAPASGVVLTKNITQGMKFTAGQSLYEIADLSKIWLLVDVFEQDLAALRTGLPVDVKVNAYPTLMFHGSVAFVYPTMNTDSRTVKVRIVLDNPDFRLKPGMYAEAHVQIPLSQHPQAVIPESALIDSGERQVVLLDKGDGKYLPQPVQVQARGMDARDQRMIAVSGVPLGGKVVTQANFLIDSESNLQAAFADMGGK